MSGFLALLASGAGRWLARRAPAAAGSRPARQAILLGRGRGRSLFGLGEPRGMAELRARRTLLKSLPELWTECSQAKSLARHLGEFGEIRITKLQPESTVAWEGDAVSGTVRLESSGWGTRVTLTVSD